jgi:hypothetical protein
MEDKPFKEFLNSLNLLINDIKKECSVVENFKEYGGETKYWISVKTLIDDGEIHLLERLSKNSENVDMHKLAGLVLVALLKRPLFFVNYNEENRPVGYYAASILFAWEAALALLIVPLRTVNGLLHL